MKEETAGKFAASNISKGSTAITDGGSNFNLLIAEIEEHEPYILEKDEVMKVLPWVHTAISSCRRTILSVYHCMKREYLQKYLSEFCYRLNCRHFKENLFERLLKISSL